MAEVYLMDKKNDDELLKEKAKLLEIKRNRKIREDKEEAERREQIQSSLKCILDWLKTNVSNNYYLTNNYSTLVTEINYTKMITISSYLENEYYLKLKTKNNFWIFPYTKSTTVAKFTFYFSPHVDVVENYYEQIKPLVALLELETRGDIMEIHIFKNRLCSEDKCKKTSYNPEDSRIKAHNGLNGS